MPVIPNLWKTDFSPFIGKTFDQTLASRKRAQELTSLLGEVTTKSLTYEIRAGGDFPTLPKFDGTLTYINPKRGFATIISPDAALGAYRMTLKAWEADMNGEYSKAGKQLADAAFTTVYIDILKLFENAFNAAFIGADGKPWAATDHPVASKGTKAGSREYEVDPDAGTFSNLITDQLDAGALDLAQAMGYRYVTASGNPYLGEYDTLIVSPELKGQALRLLGENAELKPRKDPDTANNAATSLGGITRFVVCGAGQHGFGGKQWALCDSRRMKDTAQIVYNRRPEVSEGTTSTKYEKIFVAYADYAMGFADARPIIFSNGTGA